LCAQFGGDDEVRSNFAVRQTLGSERQNLLFARDELRECPRILLGPVIVRPEEAVNLSQKALPGRLMRDDNVITTLRRDEARTRDEIRQQLPLAELK